MYFRPSTRRCWGRWRKRGLAFVASAVTLVAAYQAYATSLFGTSNSLELSPVPPLTVFVLAICFALLTLGDKLWEIHASKSRERQAEVRVRVQKALAGVLVDVSEASRVRIRDLGVSLFANRSALRRFSRPRIVRVARFRLDDQYQASQVAWAPGKGAVGKCWKREVQIYRNWSRQNEHDPQLLSAEQFRDLDDEVRDGFDYKEFLRLANKYREVLAVPLLSESGAMMGVISIDVVRGARADEGVLGSDEVSGPVHASASIIRDDLAHLDELE